MFIIGEAVIDDAVARTRFCCDLEACKGACCTLPGGRGAPLENDEVLEIQKAYPIVRQFLDSRSIKVIEAAGPVEGSPGNFATVCIDDRDCVFVFRDNGIAGCALEKAYLLDMIEWRKPLSCHLFPVRVRHFGKDVVRYEVIDECAGGRKKGEKLQEQLHTFLREPLIRKYGEAWYDKFLDYCQHQTE